MRRCTCTPNWLALHERICKGDNDAFNQLALAARPRLERWLPCRLPCSNHELIEDSITDALLAYHDVPTLFDPRRGVSLLTYLHSMARNRLFHHLRTETHRQRREDLVLLEPEAIDLAEPLSLYTHADTAELNACRQRLDELVPHLSPTERDAVTLMRAGVQEVTAWACLLPLAALSRLCQRVKIKFEKVRIKRKLRRLACCG